MGKISDILMKAIGFAFKLDHKMHINAYDTLFNLETVAYYYNAVQHLSNLPERGVDYSEDDKDHLLNDIEDFFDGKFPIDVLACNRYVREMSLENGYLTVMTNDNKEWSFMQIVPDSQSRQATNCR
ncbi:hypothetical protein FACS189425_01860 [Clostridia bacterium]|nr:hypothetical protein FACS189425_01860 [Clostridia bacterium]